MSVTTEESTVTHQVHHSYELPFILKFRRLNCDILLSLSTSSIYNHHLSSHIYNFLYVVLEQWTPSLISLMTLSHTSTLRMEVSMAPPECCPWFFYLGLVSLLKFNGIWKILHPHLRLQTLFLIFWKASPANCLWFNACYFLPFLNQVIPLFPGTLESSCPVFLP